MTELKLYNTLTRQKEVFEPIDANNVRMYVCGPTVYDFAHIGNARPVIVFDVLNRLLRHIYGENHVTYVRNITDVDDKINARALRDFPDLPLNDAIRKVTEKTANQFHSDIKALGCLEPTHEPRATEHINGMIKMIQVLIEKGNAYEAGGEVLFDVSSMENYGKLSNRKLEDQQAGARVATSSHKKNPGDFILWKLSADNQPGWPSPWGTGRPGWHIECSVMSEHHLGKVFDIHGGGLDLIFPHHENEIAQSCCAHNTDKMANIWMHNGFLQVEGKKMSKSDGNFVTISDSLKGSFLDWNAGPIYGLHLRAAMLMTHYREPIDWTKRRIVEARQVLDSAYRLIKVSLNGREPVDLIDESLNSQEPDVEVVNCICDDMDTPKAIMRISEIAKNTNSGSQDEVMKLISSLNLLGLVNKNTPLAISTIASSAIAEGKPLPILQASNFAVATANNDVQFADSISNEITNYGYSVEFSITGIVELTPTETDSQELDVEALIDQRLTHLTNKDWSAADTIRDELLTQGIQLKDGKDPDTGERITTWEVKR